MKIKTTQVSNNKLNIYEEATASLHSLIKQTTQVGIAFLVVLLLTGGNPPELTIIFCFITGIGFVAWSEQKRILQQRKPTEKVTSKKQVKLQIKNILETYTGNLSELVKISGLNPEEDFSGANLFSIRGVGCNLRGFNLSRANLIAADLRRADLSRANLRNANLQQARLNRAYLENSDFSHASLIDADLSYADMKDVNLTNAELVNANLSYTDLTGANLTRTNLKNATVKNTLFGGNIGITDQMQFDLERRGAVFPEDEMVTL